MIVFDSVIVVVASWKGNKLIEDWSKRRRWWWNGGLSGRWRRNPRKMVGDPRGDRWLRKKKQTCKQKEK
jgi:hypothetical protein